MNDAAGYVKALESGVHKMLIAASTPASASFPGM